MKLKKPLIEHWRFQMRSWPALIMMVSKRLDKYGTNFLLGYFSDVKILLENCVILKNWFAGTILLGGNSVISQPSSNDSKSYSTSGMRRVSGDVQNEDSSQQKMDTSAWGSFTGSFFHASDIGSGNDPSVSPSLEGKLTISRHILGCCINESVA